MHAISLSGLSSLCTYSRTAKKTQGEGSVGELTGHGTQAEPPHTGVGIASQMSTILVAALAVVWVSLVDRQLGFNGYDEYAA